AFSGTVLAVSGVFLASLYKWPAFEIRGVEVLTHKPSVAAYRAPVAPQTIFAIDSHMEQIARALEVDSVEFRRRHLIAPGDQIAASAYGVDIDKVKITTGDTDVAPLTGLSAGSKTIYTVGTAVLQAAEDARKQTLEIAASELEASIHDLEIIDGKVGVKGAP